MLTRIWIYWEHWINRKRKEKIKKPFILIIITSLLSSILFGFVTAYLPKPIVDQLHEISIERVWVHDAVIEIDEDRLTGILSTYEAKKLLSSKLSNYRDGAEVEILLYEDGHQKHIILGKTNICIDRYRQPHEILNGETLKQQVIYLAESQ